jgi:hypothetical protein
MNSEVKKVQGSDDYYIKNKEKILKEFSLLAKAAKKVKSLNLDASTIENVMQQAKLELEKLLIKLPFVGGDKSPFTPLIIQSAMTIAFYKASKPLEMSERELGKLLYETVEIHAQSMSTIKKWIRRKLFFSKKGMNYWKMWMIENQKKKYPKNWCGEFIESNDNSFNYGFNFTECGFIKLAKEENVSGIVPYACLCDYARMRALKIGFKRTKTLAAGDNFCDFRFIKGYNTPSGWPPEDLIEKSML